MFEEITTRFFGTRSQVPTDWAAQAIKLERPRLNRTSMDRRRRWKCSVAGRPRNFTPWEQKSVGSLGFYFSRFLIRHENLLLY